MNIRPALGVWNEIKWWLAHLPLVGRLTWRVRVICMQGASVAEVRIRKGVIES